MYTIISSSPDLRAGAQTFNSGSVAFVEDQDEPHEAAEEKRIRGLANEGVG